MRGAVGVWIGSTVGAMAGARTGARTGVRDKAALSAGTGSFVGSLLGWAALSTVGSGREPWGQAGFVIGSAAGAALGAVLVGPAPEPQGLVRRGGEGPWTVGMPALFPFGRGGPHVVLVSLRL